MDQGNPVFDAAIMDSVCDLIDFDGGLDIPKEDTEVSPNVTPNAIPPASCSAFTRRHTFEDAFSPNDHWFIPSKKLKGEPVPTEVNREPFFLPSYPIPQFAHNAPLMTQQTSFKLVVVTTRTHSLPTIKFGGTLWSCFIILGSMFPLSLSDLSRKSFGRRQELEVVVYTSTCGLLSFRRKSVQNLLVSISSFSPIPILMVGWSTRYWSYSSSHQERLSFHLR